MPAAHRLHSLAAIALLMSPGLAPIHASGCSRDSVLSGRSDPAGIPANGPGRPQGYAARVPDPADLATIDGAPRGATLAHEPASLGLRSSYTSP